MHDCLSSIKQNHIEGDILNLGVYRGYSMYLLCLIRDHLGLEDRRVLGFDTFGGFVQTDEFHDGYIDKYGENSFKHNSRQMAMENLSGFKNIDLIEGDIRETIHSLEGEMKVCFALFDMDEYTPTIASLEPVYQRLSRGGFMMHDHYAFPSLSNGMYGQRQAMNEFLENHAMFHLTGTNVFMKTE
jgi:O-methyltransferase